METVRRASKRIFAKMAQAKEAEQAEHEAQAEKAQQASDAPKAKKIKPSKAPKAPKAAKAATAPKVDKASKVEKAPEANNGSQPETSNKTTKLVLKAPKPEQAPKAEKASKAAEAAKVKNAPKAKKATKVEKVPKVEKTTKPNKITKAPKEKKVPKPKKAAASKAKAEPLPPAATGSTQLGDLKASAQPVTRRKLQKKPPGPSQPDLQLDTSLRTMKPIGEYPSPAEYRAVAVSPRIPPRRDEIDATPTLASDSGLENPTIAKDHVEYLATAPAAPIPSPDVETPADESTPQASLEDIKWIYNHEEFAVPRAVLYDIPIPRWPNYNYPRIRAMMEVSITHNCATGTPVHVRNLLYLWWKSHKDEFYCCLIDNLCKNEEDRVIDYTQALQLVLSEEEDKAQDWYAEYVRDTLPLAKLPHVAEAAHELNGPPVSPEIEMSPPATISQMLQTSQEPQMPQGSDSGLSSINPFAQAPAFKPSDIYRDTTGPRLEELFTNGKSNTAPLKRPKKPCPVNENAFQRKRQWESDSDHDERMNEKRLRFSEQQPSLMDMEFPESSMRSTVGLGPESESESDLDQSEYTFEGIPRSILRGDPRAIEAARTLPPEGEILDPEIGGDWALEPPLCMQRQQVSTPPPQSNRPHKKRKRNKGKQRARSLSVDTTISTLSSLSNSCYSLRFNDWDAPHQPRQMPNSMYSTPENNDDCEECGKGGNLVCCDTCPRAYHFKCLVPALDPNNPPQGDWHCPKCSIRNTFTTLIAHSNEHLKKTEYSAPQDVKDHFVGVDEGIVYDADYARNLKHQRYYKSAPHLPRLTKPPKQDGPTAYAHPMLLREVDTKGETIRCNNCGLSSEGVRPIITCDYCPSRFHLDCLDPPRAHPPNPKVGWMCPNHVTPEDMIVTKENCGHERARRVRRTKNMAYVDCDILLPDDPNQSLFDEEYREKRARFLAGDVVLNFIGAVKEDHRERQVKYAAQVEKKCLDLTRQITHEFLERQGAAGAKEPTSEVPASLKENVTTSVRNMIAGAPVTTNDLDAATLLLGLARTLAEPTPSSSKGQETVDLTEPIPSPKAASANSVESEKTDTQKAPRLKIFHRGKRARDDEGSLEEPAQKRQHTDSE
ncbi:Zinc finger PHD-finger [Penicillium brevicompactum]|uniref:Zinc finger PHD-finger n=1 Tax=Penicillium brevicompactum TaxID=5074 RepID=A0A9W9RU99_PENBR|nr:Zinc finger PHD-finger [Penicillium brevicompactum]